MVYIRSFILACFACFVISRPIFMRQNPPFFFLELMFFTLFCIFLFVSIELNQSITDMGENFNLKNYAGEMAYSVGFSILCFLGSRCPYFPTDICVAFYIFWLEGNTIMLAGVIVGGIRLIQKYRQNVS